MIVTFNQATGYTVVQEGALVVNTATNTARQIIDQHKDEAVSGTGNLASAHAEGSKRRRPTGSGYALS